MAAADVKLPLELNARVMAKWKDGEYHNCKILERRPNSNWQGSQEEPSAWEYYVHWSRSKRGREGGGVGEDKRTRKRGGGGEDKRTRQRGGKSPGERGD